MILRDVPLDDCHLLVPADLADQFPEPGADLARHDRLAVLGDSGQMEVDLEGGVRAAPVVFHGGASYTTGTAHRLKARVEVQGGGRGPPASPAPRPALRGCF